MDEFKKIVKYIILGIITIITAIVGVFGYFKVINERDLNSNEENK